MNTFNSLQPNERSMLIIFPVLQRGKMRHREVLMQRLTASLWQAQAIG